MERVWQCRIWYILFFYTLLSVILFKFFIADQSLPYPTSFQNSMFNTYLFKF